MSKNKKLFWQSLFFLNLNNEMVMIEKFIFKEGITSMTNKNIDIYMKISIIGVGLIGGSIALKLKQKNSVDYIYGIDNNTDNLNEALSLNIISEKAD